MSTQAGVEGTTSQGQETQQQQNGNSDTGSQGQETQQQQQQQIQAPYASHLEKLPESVRGLVEPIFKEWDTGVNQRFQQLHSQFEWAKPWQEIAQNYEPDVVSQAVNVLTALEQNPQAFYEAMGKAYGLTPQQAQQVAEQGQLGSGEEDEIDPRFQKLEETVGTLAEFLLSQQERDQHSQEEKQFLDELQRLKDAHGDFDEDYVITKIAGGMEPEDAVKAYKSLVGNANGSGPKPPVVMSSGGGLPSQNVELKNLDRRGTQGLVAQVLAAQKQQGG